MEDIYDFWFCSLPYNLETCHEGMCACVCTLLHRVFAKIGWKNFICAEFVCFSSDKAFVCGDVTAPDYLRMICPCIRLPLFAS
jgi:hypothetical protein